MPICSYAYPHKGQPPCMRRPIIRAIRDAVDYDCNSYLR